MKNIFLLIIIPFFLAEANKNNFTNRDGKILKDKLLKFNYEKKEAVFEKSGSIPIEYFSDDDQSYILQWNQVKGLQSNFKFKTSIEKKRWSQMKHQQGRTPFYMSALSIPEINHIHHDIIFADDYEEFSSILLEAYGYVLKIRNQNTFSLKNLIIESKIIYKKEKYKLHDSIYLNSDRSFNEITSTNYCHYIKENISLLEPGEEIILYSPSAIIAKQVLDRSLVVDNSFEELNSDLSTKDFNTWEDHSRERKDELIGVRFRIGINGTEDKIVWRNISMPDKLSEMEWDQL